VTFSVDDLVELSDEELLVCTVFPELVGGMAHEVVQPLNAISLTCEVFRLKFQRLGLDEAETKFFEDKIVTINNLAFKASEAISGVRKYTCLSTTGSVSGNIKTSFERVYELLRQQFIARGIDVDFQKEGPFRDLSIPSGILDLAIGQCLVSARNQVEFLESSHRGKDANYDKRMGIRLRSTPEEDSVSIRWDLGRSEGWNLLQQIPARSRLGMIALRNLITEYNGNLDVHPGQINVIFQSDSK